MDRRKVNFVWSLLHHCSTIKRCDTMLKKAIMFGYCFSLNRRTEERIKILSFIERLRKQKKSFIKQKNCKWRFTYNNVYELIPGRSKLLPCTLTLNPSHSPLVFLHSRSSRAVRHRSGNILLWWKRENLNLSIHGYNEQRV